MIRHGSPASCQPSTAPLPPYPLKAVAFFEVIIREDLSGSAAFELAETIASLPLDRDDGVRLTFRSSARIDVTGVAVLVRLYSRLDASGKELSKQEQNGESPAAGGSEPDPDPDLAVDPSPDAELALTAMPDDLFDDPLI